MGKAGRTFPCGQRRWNPLQLCNASGTLRAEAGPANIRYGLREAFASVLDATPKCLEQARPKPCDAVTDQ